MSSENTTNSSHFWEDESVILNNLFSGKEILPNMFLFMYKSYSFDYSLAQCRQKGRRANVASHTMTYIAKFSVQLIHAGRKMAMLKFNHFQNLFA